MVRKESMKVDVALDPAYITLLSAAEQVPAPGTLDAVPLAKRPAMLDRAALSFCLADAFHPGCEMTWVMRQGTLYMSPFRIRHRAPNTSEPNYGSQLTQEMVLKPDGALYGQGPGTITRWMAVLWQTDAASCRSGYYAGFGPKYDPYLPTFWPARVTLLPTVCKNSSRLRLIRIL